MPAELKWFFSHLIAMLVGGALVWAYLKYSKPKRKKPGTPRRTTQPGELRRNLGINEQPRQREPRNIRESGMP